MPQGGIEALQGQEPLSIKAFQYDMVCNGFEIASGGIRNHLPETMVKAFEMVGLDRRDGRGSFRRALSRVPVWRPAAWRHGGRHRPRGHAALGAKNLREVTMFPMNQQAYDLLMNAPSPATPTQLRELALRVVETKKA
jgi:aspartyl-tRNA synthetase